MAKFLDYTGLQTLVSKIKEHVSTSVESAQSTLQSAINAKVDKTTTVNGHALSGNVTVSKSDVGLGNVLNVAQIPATEKGAANGVATLGSDGKLTASQLPALKTINGSSIVGSGNITIDLSLYKLVDALPEEGIDDNKIYLVKGTESGEENVYTEYIHVTPEEGEPAWEKIGEYKSNVDLTPYVKFTDVESSLSDSSTKPVQNKVIKAALDGKAAASHTHEIANVNGLQDALNGKAASNHTHQNFIVKLNGGSNEGTNQFTYNGGAAKTVNITPSGIGAAASGHNHDANYVQNVAISGNQIAVTKNGEDTKLTVPFATSATNATNATNANHATNADTASKVTNSFVVKVNSGTTEGTSQYTFNGSTAKSLDIKAGSNVSIGTAAGALTISATDTKYTAGTGLKLTGTEIAVNTNGNAQQFLNGNGTWSTPANTTYGAGTGLDLSGTTFNLNVASDSEIGGIAIGYEENGKNYPVELDAEGGNKAFVNVPWTDTTYSNATTGAAGLMSAEDKKKLDGIATNANNYSLPTANASTLGGVKSSTTGTTPGRDYNVQVNSDGTMKVNVPWTDNNTTYAQATDSTLGLVKIGFTESGKNYPVELSEEGQMFVNVPWTDNNTTYTAGTGLSLSGNTFAVRTGYTTDNGARNYKVTTDGSGNLYVNVPWTDTVDTAISDEEINDLF